VSINTVNPKQIAQRKTAMRSAHLGLVIVLAAFAQPALAAKLKFLGVTAKTAGPIARALDCKDLKPSNYPRCELARTSFGNVQIVSSRVNLNPQTMRVWGLNLRYKKMDDEAAVAALTAKYGAPTKDTKTPTKNRIHGTPFIRRLAIWDSFDNGRLLLHSGEDDSSIEIYFPKNMTASELAKEPQRVWF
jgi:hypothetical protein